jgi:outer membrane immunogenic protein
MMKTVITGLMLGLMPAAAMAADLGGYPRGGSIKDAPQAYYPAVYNWSGFYVGIQGGYAWGDNEANTTLSNGTQPVPYSYSTDGFVGGAHAGYNWQANNLVLGLESDIEFSDIGGSGRTGVLTHSTDVDWLGSLRARFGVAVDRTLIYATGGLAFGDVTLHETGRGNLTDFRTGWTAGGGVEHAINRGLTARLEYRYTDLGNDSVSYSGINDKSDAAFSAVRAGLSWRF